MRRYHDVRVSVAGDEGWRVLERRFDNLTVRVASSTAEMADAAANQAGEALGVAIERRGHANGMFATGNSQLEFLESLVSGQVLDWARVSLFHMDEYVGIAGDHPASFRRYIRERLAERVRPATAHYLAGDAPDLDDEAKRYEALLTSHPLDLCALGIGENGHLAFNDPGIADFSDPMDVKVVELDRACRQQQVGEGHFATFDDVPRRAITVTVPALLRAATVVAVVPEGRKAVPVRDALTGPVSTACPASILRTRTNATLYLDAGSAGLIEP